LERGNQSTRRLAAGYRGKHEVDQSNFECFVDSDHDLLLRHHRALTYKRKDLAVLTNEQGAGEHCQVGAHTLLHQTICDWLDDMLAER
jgi:hypothetical protein